MPPSCGSWTCPPHSIAISVPYVVGRSALYGSSHLQKFQDDLFAVTNTSYTCNGEDAFLIPTAEVPVTNLHAQRVLENAFDLPLCRTWRGRPCFRADSYSRDTAEYIRTHPSCYFSKGSSSSVCLPRTIEAHHTNLLERQSVHLFSRDGCH